jgi:probable phosphoglycerate mutase
MQEPTRIIAIRHGETAWNAKGRIQGHQDTALNATGMAQARQLARALGNTTLDCIYSSDLQRAMATAEALARTTGAPIVPEPRLRERCFGEYEGRTFAEVEREAPEHARLWRVRDPGYAPRGGESLLALQQRISQTVDRLAAHHGGQLIALVAHGGVLDMLYRLATRQHLQAPRTWQLGNAAINRLLWSSDSGLALVGWGDVQHLEGAARDERHD